MGKIDWSKPIEVFCGGEWVAAKHVDTSSSVGDKVLFGPKARKWRIEHVVDGMYYYEDGSPYESGSKLRNNTETPLEQFARETGVTVTDENRAAIEAALAWGR